MEVVLVEASGFGAGYFSHLSGKCCGRVEDLQWLLERLTSVTARTTAVLKRLTRVVPLLAAGDEAKTSLLIEHFRNILDFNKYDGDHTPEEGAMVSPKSFLIIKLKLTNSNNKFICVLPQSRKKHFFCILKAKNLFHLILIVNPKVSVF